MALNSTQGGLQAHWWTMTVVLSAVKIQIADTAVEDYRGGLNNGWDLFYWHGLVEMLAEISK